MDHDQYPPQEAVEASVEATASRLGQYKKKLLVLLEQEPRELAELGMVDRDAATARLRAVVDEVHTILNPHVPCKKGCNYCCTMAVTISSKEAEEIANAYGLRAASPDPAVDQQQEVKKWLNHVCPFLSKDGCRVYEHRPLACRTFYNLSAYPQLCDTVKYPGSPVPNLNFTTVWAAQALMDQDLVMADIRAFFPSGFPDGQSL